MFAPRCETRHLEEPTFVVRTAPLASPPVSNAWIKPRAIRLHLTVLVLVPTFLLLGRWQLGRAIGGNGLSWAYTFEWPLFAVYAIYIWWRLLHDDRPVAPRRKRPRAVLADAQADADREAYNTYLKAIHDEQKTG